MSNKLGRQDTRYFKLAKELNHKFANELLANEVHFRGSVNSISLVSVSKQKPEIGITCTGLSIPTDEELSKEPCSATNACDVTLLNKHIAKLKSMEPPQRLTPEKGLQAHIIKEALQNNHCLPFNRQIRFITSELALFNQDGKKMVSDIIGFDTERNHLVIIELKSARDLKTLIRQVTDFEKIAADEFDFFSYLVRFAGNSPILSLDVHKAIVWPHERTSPLEKLKDLDIAEYTYQENGDSYSFIDHSKNNKHRFAHLTKFDIEADFLTFREQIVEEFGKPNLEQTILFFERAVAQANKDLLHSAIADAQTAYTFSQFNDEYRIVYLIGFLSELHIDTEDFRKARAYCELGYKMLDTDDTDYADDKTKFDELKEIIDSESWKDDRNKNE